MEVANEIGRIIATIFCAATFMLVAHEMWNGLKSQPEYAIVAEPLSLLFVAALIIWKWGI